VAPQLAAASEEPLWPLSDDFSADRYHLSEPIADAVYDPAELKAVGKAFDAAWGTASAQRQSKRHTPQAC
jgi:hypothetical protein